MTRPSLPPCTRPPCDVSVIIPTLNEQDQVVEAIRSAQNAGASEIIVCDGGSQDETHRVATEAGITQWVHSPPGRGIQLAAGLAVAQRKTVLFLHADNQLDPACLHQMGQHPEFTWGAFQQRITSPRWPFRLIEWGNAARVRWRSMAFGDQALFADRASLIQHGGISEIPLMEDVDLSQRLRKIAPPVLLPGPVMISPRRWEETGILRQTLRNWNLQWRHARGDSPESLTKRY